MRARSWFSRCFVCFDRTSHRKANTSHNVKNNVHTFSALSIRICVDVWQLMGESKQKRYNVYGGGTHALPMAIFLFWSPAMRERERAPQEPKTRRTEMERKRDGCKWCAQFLTWLFALCLLLLNFIVLSIEKEIERVRVCVCVCLKERVGKSQLRAFA